MDPKPALYASLLPQLRAALADSPDFVAAMATAAAVLKDGLPHASWVGFYLPEADGALRVGPYQGPLACVRLPPGRGVCGAAAQRRETVVVPDVHAFPGHIACDPRSRSEIVVPVLAGERLVAVLDVDSAEPAAFDDADRRGLEEAAALIAAQAPPRSGSR